ncbi:hypothetical protein F4820DRAFT_138719 [Hypoxylon rubiginosum]|uniref:Uncharacterized protein n=1 Tax=Hypoxylon rubiginosum TaxID=110542 RepID=A0ACB9YKB1_9PEZI|nr:hypothetical protein F4820DRAFT_138719 [Hypoxylon rubiginosum]
MAEHKTPQGEAIPEQAAIVISTVPPASTVSDSSKTPTKEQQDIKENATIELPPASVADDAIYVATLVDIINAAYNETEADIFKPGYVRTTPQGVEEILRAGELAVASVPAAAASSSPPAGSSGRVPVGCISIKKLGATRAELGMFAVGPAQRGTGLGRDLIAFAERWCRDALGGPGVAVAQLDLLVPTHVEHAFKARLGAWYGRLGYRMVGSRDFALDYPRLAPLLAGPTEYRVFEKTLV